MTIHAFHRTGVVTIACTSAAIALSTFALPAHAAITSTVPLGTSAQYAVVGASTVTNTGNSVLNGSLGLSPGTSITGFPPGIVVPPGTINKTNAAAAQARADLTAAYLDAQGRPIDATTPADLANRHLQAGVYAGPGKGALSLTGPLVLDAAGDPSAVFIFQTNSTLITASSSTVSLINGAQQCNVFWQVGSSATLGTGSVFVGNILALSSISMNNGVTVHGRALARNGAVTLINDVFTKPTCDMTRPGPTPTTSTTTPTSPATTAPGSGTPTSGTPGAGTGSGTNTSTPGVNGVGGVGGPPRTDATPIPHGGFPWMEVTLVGGGVVAAMAGLMLTVHSARARKLAAAMTVASHERT